MTQQQAAPAKEKKPKKVHVVPSAETNRRILAECSKTVIDIKKVIALYNVSHNDAVILAAAAEQGWIPQIKK
jgi:hypothetical protein